MRHRELDSTRADLLRPLRRAGAEEDARLGPAADLDLLPREVHTGAQRLSDRLFRGEPPGVVLRRVRLRVTVRALCFGEAPLLEALAVACERAADAFDLDQVDPD